MDPQAPPSGPPRPAPLRPLVLGVVTFLVVQYGAALLRLGQSSGAMKNKFSALARDEYLGFLVRQNLWMIAAYVVLACAALLLVRPLLSLRVWQRFPVMSKPWALLLAAFAATATLHGYFTLRLTQTRPYFVDPAEFGRWYYKAFDLLPLAVRQFCLTTLFTVLPVLGVAAAATWHLRRFRRRGWIGTGAAAIVGAGSWAAVQSGMKSTPPAAKTHSDRPNLLIIASDSLRGDKLGCAGYQPARRTGAAAAGVSPAIDALAARSVRFERCYSAIASTLESSVQTMSSQYPQSHGIRQMYPDRATVESTLGRIEPLAAVLTREGYDTAAIGDWCAGFYEMMPMGFESIAVSTFDNFKIYMSQAVVMAHNVVPLYFDNPLGYLLFPQIQAFAQFVTPEVVTQRVERRLESAARTGKPFFWHVFYSCNHLPYGSPEPYASMFADPDYRGPNQARFSFDIDSFIGGTDLESKWKALPPAEIDQVRALYDGCTRQFDACVERIVAALEKNGLARNTVVIITADHGDDLYEPGVTLGHGLTFNGALHANHVPMIVHVPGTAPRVIPETVRLVDLAPTLADLAGAPKPASWQGLSFAGWLRGEAPREHRPFYGETGFPFIQFRVPGVERPKLPPMDGMTRIDETFNYQFVLKPEYQERLVEAKQRCLRTRDWKIVCTPTAAGGRHFGLYHLVSDPHAERDLATTRPEVLAPLRTALERWMDEHVETPIPHIFPGDEPG